MIATNRTETACLDHAPATNPPLRRSTSPWVELVVRQHTAPQAHVYLAKLALLPHVQPAQDNPSAARQLGKQENWVRYCRCIRSTDGFRLANQARRNAGAPMA